MYYTIKNYRQSVTLEVNTIFVIICDNIESTTLHNMAFAFPTQVPVKVVCIYSLNVCKNVEDYVRCKKRKHIKSYQSPIHI